MEDKKKILLVDDDEASVEISKIALEQFYEIEAAYNSMEGMEKIKSGRFDLLILDLMMEDRDSGFTMAYAIKNDPALKDIPIIMLTSAPAKTGFHFDFDKDKDWLKVDDLIEKPIRAKDLLAKVKKFIGF